MVKGLRSVAIVTEATRIAINTNTVDKVSVARSSLKRPQQPLVRQHSEVHKQTACEHGD